MAFYKNFKSFFTINMELLPMKMHFFFYALGLGAALTYFPLIAKDIGLSATALGTIFTIVPFSTVLVSPAFGCITDKFKKLKHVVMLLIIIQTPLYFSINYIPPVTREIKYFNANLTCSLSAGVHSLESSYFSTLSPSNTNLECHIDCSECFLIKLNEPSNTELVCEILHFRTEPFHNKSLQYLNITHMFTDSIPTNISSFNCTDRINDVCHTKCILDVPPENANMFYVYQFWVYLVLLTTALIATNVTIALSDAACHEELKGRVNLYGKQRVWLSIGWGLISLITGYMIDLVNEGSGKKTDYTYCFYLMIPLMVIDIICIYFTDMRKQTTSKNILKDVSKIFTKPHPFILLFAVYIIGIFSALQWNYKFWYLEDIGATKLLLGLSIGILCLCSEVPFMFISGWIIKRIGRDHCMCLAFTTFGIWFVSVSYLQNPWWIILIDITQGPSYGLFYAAMSSYGKIVAPPGTEATLQTILGAAFHGLGIGSGSLLGGLGLDNYGARATYRFSGFFAFGITVLYKVTTMWIAGEDRSLGSGKDEKEKEDEKKEIEIAVIDAIVIQDKDIIRTTNVT